MVWWIKAALILVGLLIELGAASALTPTAAQESCTSASELFDDARAAGDTERAIAVYGRLSQATTRCEAQIVYCAGNALALDLLAQAYAAQDQEDEPAKVTSLLERASDFGAPWQLLVGLADVEFQRGQTRKDAEAFEQAALYYQEALNELSDPPVCAGGEVGPTEEEIGAVFNRMTEALMLAPQFKVARTRSGRCGGLFLARVRGFTPRFRPIPISFVFAEANFTEAGSDAAAILLDCLKESGSDRIVLSGHTDPIGSDDYNLELSARRLERVVAYLRRGGFEGDVTVLPKGESEPFEPDDPLAYSEKELHQLSRRVVLRDWAQ